MWFLSNLAKIIIICCLTLLARSKDEKLNLQSNYLLDLLDTPDICESVNCRAGLGNFYLGYILLSILNPLILLDLIYFIELYRLLAGEYYTL